MDSNQPYWVGGTLSSNTIDELEIEWINPKRKKAVEVRKGNCEVCNRSKSQFFTK